tara:strand:+ start:76 stop:540 length:465 start_codon:yes stop_codon:yes gene_type:complete
MMKKKFYLIVAFLGYFNALFAAGDFTMMKPISVEIEMQSSNNVHVFSPNRIRLETGKLYKIRVFNNSNEKHYFSSKKFAESVFTRKVQILKDGKKIAEVKGIIAEVEVFPYSVIEWWVVPIRTGIFDDLHCHVKDVRTGKTHNQLGMNGVISIY